MCDCDCHEWKKIEEAPKDGTRVLLGLSEHEYVMIGFYGPKYSRYGVSFGDAWGDGTTWDAELPNVTHWMPLPAPPELESKSLKEPE